MKRAVFYARVSTEEEKQKSALRNQCEELEELINKNPDWVLVDSYVDEGKSGTTTEGREEYNRLFEDLFENKFDIIVIRDLSRLNRSERDWYNFSGEMIEQKIQLYIKLDNKFYDPDEDEIVTGFKTMMNAQRSRELSKKMRDAQGKRLQKNHIITNGKMWGYLQKDGKLIPNEEEVPIIQRIFELYADGMGFTSIKKIIDTMLTDKIKENRQCEKIAMTTVKRIVRNTAYKGMMAQGKITQKFKSKKQTIKDKTEWKYIPCPAIVSEELWEKANEQLEKKRKDYGIDEKAKIFGYFSGSYPLSAKIKCGKCDKTYYHARYNTMKYPLWECSSYRTYGKNPEKGGCDNPRIPVHELSEIVKEVIYDYWQNKDESINKILVVLDKVLVESDYTPQISKLTKKIAKIETTKKNARHKFYDGLVEKEDYLADIASFDKELKRLKEELQALENKGKDTISKKERLLHIRDKLDFDISSKENITDEIIKEMVEKITITGNVLEIVLNGGTTFIKESKGKKSPIMSNAGSSRSTY